MLKYCILFILLVDYTYSQQILPGGCGLPVTNIIYPFFPQFGISPGLYFNSSALSKREIPYEFLTDDGIWCGYYAKYFDNTTANINNVVVCSSQHFDGTTFSNTNGCGITYYSTFNNTTTSPNDASVTLTYNMCPKINATTGGIFPMQLPISGSRFVKVSRSYPSDIGTVLATLASPTVFLFSSIFTDCADNTFWTSQSNGIINSYIFNGVSAITAGASYSGNLFLYFRANDRIKGLSIIYNNTNTNLVIANMTQTSLIVLDTILWPSSAIPQMSSNEITAMLNTTTGYLYFTTTNTGPGFTPIFQINMTTYKFIRNQQFGNRWRFASVSPFGVGNQMLMAFVQGSTNLESMWCIKDPYNPVLLTQLAIQNYTTFQTSFGLPSSFVGSMRVPLGHSPCFSNTEFIMNMNSASHIPVYMDYCGSGVYNNISFCNTPSSGSTTCCPQTCSISTSTVCANATSCLLQSTCFNGTCPAQVNQPDNVTLCLNSTSCTNASYCLNGTCPVPLNYPNFTSCGLPNSTCYSGDFCISGNCSLGTKAPNTTLCTSSTSCTNASFCSNGTCPIPLNYPNFTLCGSPNTTCYSGDFCISGNCSLGLPTANGTLCGQPETPCYTGDFCYLGNCSLGHLLPNTTLCSPGTSCTDPAYCNNSVTCPPNPPFPINTVCGFPISSCYTGDLCNATGFCITGHNEPDSKVCFNETSCIYGSNCSSGVCPTPIDKPDLTTVCGIPPSTCYSGDVCFTGNCITGVPSSNTTSCSSSPGICYDNGRCSGINQTCLSPLPFPNGTLCGPNPTDCQSAFLCYLGSCINGTDVPDGTPCGSVSSTSCVTSGLCESGLCLNSSYHPPGTLCGQNQSSLLCLTDPVCNLTGGCIPSHPKPAGTLCFISSSLQGVCDDFGNCIITSSPQNNITLLNITHIFNAFLFHPAFFATLIIGLLPILVLLIILFNNNNKE